MRIDCPRSGLYNSRSIRNHCFVTTLFPRKRIRRRGRESIQKTKTKKKEKEKKKGKKVKKTLRGTGRVLVALHYDSCERERTGK